MAKIGTYRNLFPFLHFFRQKFDFRFGSMVCITSQEQAGRRPNAVDKCQKNLTDSVRIAWLFAIHRGKGFISLVQNAGILPFAFFRRKLSLSFQN